MKDNMCLYEKIISGIAKEVKSALLENEESIEMTIHDKENKIFDLAEAITDKTGEKEVDLYVAQDYIAAQVYIYSRSSRGEPTGQMYIDIEDVYIDTDMRDITVFTDERDEYNASSIEEASTPEEYNEFLDTIIKHLENYEIPEEV